MFLANLFKTFPRVFAYSVTVCFQQQAFAFAITHMRSNTTRSQLTFETVRELELMAFYVVCSASASETAALVRDTDPVTFAPSAVWPAGATAPDFTCAGGASRDDVIEVT